MGYTNKDHFRTFIEHSCDFRRYPSVPGHHPARLSRPRPKPFSGVPNGECNEQCEGQENICGADPLEPAMNVPEEPCEEAQPPGNRKDPQFLHFFPCFVVGSRADAGFMEALSKVYRLTILFEAMKLRFGDIGFRKKLPYLFGISG